MIQSREISSFGKKKKIKNFKEEGANYIKKGIYFMFGVKRTQMVRIPSK